MAKIFVMYKARGAVENVFKEVRNRPAITSRFHTGLGIAR
jgi:hypothetical protein